VMDAKLRALSSILPSVNDAVRNGTVGSAEAANVMARASVRLFPNAVHVFACGSHSAGSQRPYSDLDIIVTSDTATPYERKCVVFEGYPLDFQNISLRTIKAAVARAKASGIGFTVHALSRALILRDSDGNAAALRDWVSAEWSKQKVDPHPRSREVLKMAMCDLLLDLCTVRTENEMMACGLSAYHVLINMLTPQKIGWLSTGKFVPRELGDMEPDVYPQIIDAYRQLLQGAPDALIVICLDAVDAWGGPAWDGFVQTK
jgi:hypothetical protein